MRVGRNDPCPCGSGKKYKRCCEPLDRGASRGAFVPVGAGSVRQAARTADVWEADVAPIPPVADDPQARPGIALVVGSGLILRADVVGRPSPETAALAELLAATVRATVDEHGSVPRQVRVRDADVAAALAPHLAGLGGGALAAPPEGPSVVVGRLDELDDALAGFDRHSGGSGAMVRICRPRTWAGWDLPAEVVADFFRAAAAYHRAAPWELLSDEEEIEAVFPSGARRTLVVLGAAGESFGLNLFDDPEDAERLVLAAEGGHPLALVLHGALVAVTFDAVGELERAARREIVAAGWELAAADAAPSVFTVNTPAGGLRQAAARETTAALAAVARFIEQHGEGLRLGQSVPRWRDEATGVELTVLDHEIDGALLPELLPGSAEGPGAEPEAALRAPPETFEEVQAFEQAELLVVERFAAWLERESDLAAATRRRHATNAGVFVEFLAHIGVPLRAVHELDLRDFLRDWYPRKGDASAVLRRAMPTSLEKFFHYLAYHEGIACPWGARVAGEFRARRDELEEAPRGFFWDDDVHEWRRDAAAELADHLLLPDLGLAGDQADDEELEWGEFMGPEEALLHRELARRWLLWRDELLRGGTTDRNELIAALLARQHEWETTPHPRLAGRTPVATILAERRETEERVGKP